MTERQLVFFKTDTLYIDDNKFLGTPFKLLEDLPPGVDNRFIGIAPMNNIVLPVNNFPPNLTNYKSNTRCNFF